MPDGRIEDQYLTDALAKRKTKVDASTLDALVTLATGLLRRFHTGTADAIFDPLKKWLGIDEKAQFAQGTVDWYVEGVRDNPPFPERPSMRGEIESIFSETLDRNPSDVELEVLLDCLVGAERDLFLAPSPGKRIVLAEKLVDAFQEGGV
jgi:hypothetical protein